MLNSQAANSLSGTTLLKPGSKADTAAATGAWTATTLGLAGFVLFMQHAGVLAAGTLDGKIQTADDNSGTNSVDLVTYTQVTTSNDDPNLQTSVVPATALKAYVRYIGTVVTGAANVSSSMVYSPGTV